MLSSEETTEPTVTKFAPPPSMPVKMKHSWMRSCGRSSKTTVENDMRSVVFEG